MPVVLVRNKRLLPFISEEGYLTKNIAVSTTDKHSPGVDVYSRLFSHHTLASVRRLSFFVPRNVPECSMELALQSTYDHARESFTDPVDVVMQRETRGCATGRRLRNTRARQPVLQHALGHPLRRGGVPERRSPHSVKLMNSGIHSAQTNPGYSRQPAGGAIFFY